MKRQRDQRKICHCEKCLTINPKGQKIDIELFLQHQGLLSENEYSSNDLDEERNIGNFIL